MGELVNAVDHKNRFLARLLEFPLPDSSADHVLEDEPIDDAWWRKKLQRALSLRSELNASGSRSACRLVNAENDFLPV